MDIFGKQERRLFLPSIAFTSKRKSSRNKCFYNPLTKQGIITIIPSKKEQLLNSTVKPKPSSNLRNKIICKRLEVLFHLWNTGKEKIKQRRVND